jgi:hypothetical protein
MKTRERNCDKALHMLNLGNRWILIFSVTLHHNVSPPSPTNFNHCCYVCPSVLKQIPAPTACRILVAFVIGTLRYDITWKLRQFRNDFLDKFYFCQ